MMKETMTLAFVGDVMLGRGVNEEIVRRVSGQDASLMAASFWGDVLPVLKAADGVIANLECAITSYPVQCRRTPKVFHFRADPVAVEVLRAGNIRWVSLANNHILDFDDQGLFDTLHYLDAAGIGHAGAGRTDAEAIAPALITLQERTIGLIAITDNESAFAAEHNRPGTYYLEITIQSHVLQRVEHSVKQAQEAGAQWVILSAHWGPNMVTTPPNHFQDFAHATVDLGVDIFYGHSAHIFQAVEHYKQGLILYDTGDFLDDYAVDPDLHNDWSFVFLVDLNGNRIQRLRLIPVHLDYARVELARGQEFDAICERMRSRCTKFHTPLVRTPEGLELVMAD